MTDRAQTNGSKVVPTIILFVAAVNLMFLLTEIAINVLGAMLPL